MNRELLKISTEYQIPVSQSTPGQSPNQDIIAAAKGGSISFFGRLVEYGVRFFFSVIVARMIGAEQFGLYTLGLIIVPILSMLSLLGLQTGMVRYMPAAIRKHDDKTTWGIIQVGAGIPAGIGIIFAISLFCFAEPIAIQIFKEPRLVPVLRLVCLSIPLESLMFMGNTVLQSYKRLEFRVLAEFITLPLVKLILTLGFLAAGLGVMGIVRAHVIAEAVALVLVIIFVNSLFPLKRPLTFANRNVGQILSYSLPSHIGWVINTMRGTFETLVLGVLGMTTGVGVYTAAARISAIGGMFFTSIASIAAPIISDLYCRGDFDHLKRFYCTTNKWLVTFNLPLFFTFLIFADPLLSIFGSDFKTGATSLAILSAGTLVYAGTGVGATMLDFTDHNKVNSVNSVCMVAITLILDLMLIPRWGVIGAAVASALSTVIVNLLCLLEVYYYIRILPFDRSFFKPIVAGLASAGVTTLIIQHVVLSPLFQFAVCGALLWIVYTLLLLLFGISEEDRILVNGLRSRLNFKIPL